MTRRELFKLILAAPFVKIVKKSLENPYMSQAYENRLEMLYGGNAGGGKTDSISLYGIPYHESNATTGTWLGFSREDK